MKTLTYDNPVTAVLLRQLAWEHYVAKREISVKDAVTRYVQRARADLGLDLYKSRQTSGGADDFVQQLRTAKLLSPAGSGIVKPIESKWEAEWRLLYLPPHDLVRQLSVDPVYVPISSTGTEQEFKITLRNPAIPALRVHIGWDGNAGSAVPVRRGLYLLGLQSSLYIGSSTEFAVRSRQHTTNKQQQWYIFFSIDDNEQTFSLDTLHAAEGLLISFWNEVSVVANQNRGSDQKPAFLYLQPAILLVMGISAAFIWLLRERTMLGLPSSITPFLKPTRYKNWPDCYLTGSITPAV